MTSKVEIFGAALGKAIRRTTDKIRDGQFDEKDRESQMNAWDDPRIARGMEKQLAVRRARIAAGEKPLGWKVGLGAPPAMERLKIKGPLVGFMMQKSLLPNASTVPVGNWHKLV